VRSYNFSDLVIDRLTCGVASAVDIMQDLVELKTSTRNEHIADGRAKNRLKRYFKPPQTSAGAPEASAAGVPVSTPWPSGIPSVEMALASVSRLEKPMFTPSVSFQAGLQHHMNLENHDSDDNTDELRATLAMTKPSYQNF
jgi:hypothetical protein